MKLSEMADFLDNYPAGWPPKEFFVNEHVVTKVQLEQFREILNYRSDETTIDTFLRNNPEVMVNALSFASTGHHGAWVVPQQNVRPPQVNVIHGLKPDYIVGGRSSDGFKWFVIELKGANEKIFSNSNGRLIFSKTVHKGVFQLLEYIDYCSEIQSYLRDTLQLTGFREPKGILLIGREDEIIQDKYRERLKSAWNRFAPNLEVRTYDSLLRFVDGKVKFYGAYDKKL